ncbi:NAD(P)-dependent oxidoreductase [Pseudoruegeria sp. SK021]|uniref:NAD-dependent epimerase/dehydratase family protein n=1 Tax=Pseudoruegeria sp. SK021 TaxID=1933035 RepID=UPI000A326805|nr:NAD(P)-dependent oxidoreductase [Pseudoruegeria sp. SK021]
MSDIKNTPAALLDGACLPDRFDSVEALDDFIALPSRALIDDLAAVDGDIMILGASGKMGPSLARLARNAAPTKRIIAVARFSDPASKTALEMHGIETIICDLFDAAAIGALPKVKNIIFMAGRKFGSGGNQPLTWAANTHIPALVAQAFSDSRIVAFSTGCVYAFSPVDSMGSDEGDALDPPGEYAQSCIGRERMFEHFSAVHDTPGRIYRLNYAIDLRYGVLHDIAVKVRDGVPIDVTMGHVNVIWQGDANTIALRCLKQATTPTSPINVTGPEVISVRWLAGILGKKLGIAPIITGEEAPEAWLSNTRLCNGTFGYPTVPLDRMLDWTANWVSDDLPSHNKPTHFEARDGTY